MSDTHRAHRTGLGVCAVGAVLLITACSGDSEPEYSEALSLSETSSPSPEAEQEAPDTDSEPDDGSESEDEADDEEAEAREADDAAETDDEEESTSEDSEDADGANADESSEEDVEPTVMEASEPSAVSIPSIGVESELMDLGLQDDGVIEVPPYNAGSPAGWYTHGPTPGEQGPSVILGHRNAIEGGPGIFADLPDMEEGDSIDVARGDGTTASFTVYRTEQFVQEEFPTLDVYGNTDEAEIRLITCDGFNPETGQLEDNYIVYATLDT